MKKQQALPTIARIIDELDGSYLGTTLYGIVREMDWGRHGHRTPTTEGARIAFYSPTHNNLRGTFSIFYYDKYPKKCLPTRSELEVEIYSGDGISLLLTSIFERSCGGVLVSLYHRDGRSSFPIFYLKRLSGPYAKELWRYQQDPMGALPSPMNEESDMILLTHLALASAVSWRSDIMRAMPHVDYLLEPLEKMIRATYDYDQKVQIPPNAA